MREPLQARILVSQHFAVQDPLKLDQGLPRELSALYNKFPSLDAVHLYHPYQHEVGQLRPIFKLTWTHHSQEEFVLESVWIKAFETWKYEIGNEGNAADVLPAHVSQLLERALNVTFEAPYRVVPIVAPVFLPAWSSLQSLTIISEDFPTPDFLRRIPNTVDLLIIKFEANMCRGQPFYLDRRFCGFLRSRATTNVRVCISMKVTSMEGDSNSTSWFQVADEKLFVTTRALCIERGGRFMCAALASAIFLRKH